MKQKLLFLLTALCFGFVSGVKADATYVYFNDFETTSDKTATGTATGSEKVDATIQGSGSFNNEGGFFGKVFQNVGGALRSNYLLLPDDALAHASESQALTIGFWVSAGSLAADAYTYAPFFAAYSQAPNPTNGSPMFVSQSRGSLQVNLDNGKWCDFAGAQNVNGKITIYNTNSWEASDANFINGGNWLDDHNWHYFTIVMTPTNAKIYMDGTIKNEWNIDGTSTGQQNDIFDNGANLKYICLGGNQAWDWGDNDGGFKFDDLYITNVALTQAEIEEIIADKGQPYNYTVKAYDGSHNLLKQIASGTYTGTDITVAYPQYIQVGTTLYNIPQNGSGDYFRTTFTPDADNYEKELTYNGSTVSDVYLYIEGEDISGISQANYTARASYGKMGYTSNISTFVSVANLPAGTYQIYARPVRTNNDDATCKFKVGEEEKFSMTMQKGAYDIQNSEPFTIESAQALSIACEGSSTSGLDWLYLKGTPKYEVVGATDCSTGYDVAFCTTPTCIRAGEQAHFRIVNHNTGKGNSWDNWYLFANASTSTKPHVLDIRPDQWTDGGVTQTNTLPNDFNYSVDYSGATVDIVATLTDAGDGTYTFKSTTTIIKADGTPVSGSKVDTKTGLTQSALYLYMSVQNSWIEITNQDVIATLGANGYTTFASPNALDMTIENMPDGVRAFTASITGNTVSFTKLDQTVPANTGVLLASTDAMKGQTVQIPVVASGDPVENNRFIAGTGAELPTDEDNYYFALNKNKSDLTFGKFDQTSVVINTNKAYFKVAKNDFGSGARLVINFEGATGINTVEVAEPEANALKDGTFLENGKIVIVKNGVKYGVNGQKLN